MAVELGQAQVDPGGLTCYHLGQPAHVHIVDTLPFSHYLIYEGINNQLRE